MRFLNLCVVLALGAILGGCGSVLGPVNGTSALSDDPAYRLPTDPSQRVRVLLGASNEGAGDISANFPAAISETCWIHLNVYNYTGTSVRPNIRVTFDGHRITTSASLNAEVTDTQTMFMMTDTPIILSPIPGSARANHYYQGPYTSISDPWQEGGVDLTMAPGEHTEILFRVKVVEPSGSLTVIVE